MLAGAPGGRRGNLRLARPVIFADRGVLPEFGRHDRRIRVRVVEALVAALISPPGLAADFQPVNGIGLGTRSAHSGLPFSLRLCGISTSGSLQSTKTTSNRAMEPVIRWRGTRCSCAKACIWSRKRVSRLRFLVLDGSEYPRDPALGSSAPAQLPQRIVLRDMQSRGFEPLSTVPGQRVERLGGA